jgi:hypothetical protein
MKMKLGTALPAAISIFRRWEERDFDVEWRDRLLARAPEAEAERVRRALVTRVPSRVASFQAKEALAWARNEAERIAREESYWAHLEVVAAEDSGYSEDEQEDARITLAAKEYRELQRIIAADPSSSRQERKIAAKVLTMPRREEAS